MSVAAAACLGPYAEAWAELEHGGGDAVVEALRAGVERHGELITSVGLDGDAPPEWTERADRLLEYRRQIDAALLTPLSRAYGSHGPATVLMDALRRAGNRCAELCTTLPERTEAPWPEDALTPKPSDSLGRRLGKAFARLFSKARKAGTERSLPLRHVALGHLRRVVIPGQDEVIAEGLVGWGRWSRRLELLWVEWAEAALPALVRAELPHHEPDGEEEVWSTIREAALELQAGLESLLADDPGDELLAAARARLAGDRSVLEADLAVAGSFLLDPSRPPTDVSSLPRVASVGPALVEWDEGVGARMYLQLSLLSILSGATAVQRRMVWRFRDRCLSGVGALSESAGRFEELADETDRPGWAASLEAHLDELDKKVEAALEPAKQAVPEPFTVDAAVREISDSTIDALTAMIRQAPAAVVLHSSSAKVPVSGRKVETRTLPLQELARQSFDALRIERIRSSTSGLAEGVDEARKNVSELEEVYSFARDQATKELASDEEGARARTEDLIEGALRNTAEALRAQVTSLEAAVEAAQKRLAAEISDGSVALLDRVGAGRMEARLFAAASRVADLRAWISDRLGPPVERGRRYLTVRFARLRRLGARAMRKGSAMVGSAPTETAASARTLRALADPEAGMEGIPLVYRRLFTTDAVSDPALMAGRDAELAEAMRRWRRWHDEEGIPLIVRGRQGSGVTSFLHVLESRIDEDGSQVERATLHERVTDEEGLAALLAGSLGLEPTDSLDRLAGSIFHVSQSSLPAAVVLDNLEHLYLRVPCGTDLLERLFTLMAETEPRIFWIGGITASAWQMVATAEPTAISQVDLCDLPPLPASDLRAAIILRHRRSGLAVRYEEPTTGRHLLRRRLHRMRDAGSYQHLLEDDYFERLHKASGGHLGLALHQWLVAADFTTGDGVLMRHPERPDFSVLEALDLTQNFTLKAFLEHRSLTLAEHDRIFRLPRHESYQIFESLRNRHLLEPLVRSEEDPEARSEIQEDLRYRVRPLLTGAVISHLQARNIVH